VSTEVWADPFAAVRKPVDPYGNPLSAAPSTWPDAHGFLDKPLDQVTGLTDVGARKYDASIGRFISRDPLTEPSDPTQLNGYAYGGDNPVNQADPTGKSLWSWVGDHIGTIAVVTAIVVAIVVVAVVAAPVLAAAGAALSSTASTAAAAAGAAVETSAAAATAASAAEGAATAFAATGSPAMAAVGAASNAITTAAPAVLGAGAVGTTVAAAGAVVSEFVGASNSPGPRGGSGCNSFAGDTPVLMADGSAKAIEDVRVGDTVTDSEAGSDRDEKHTVTAIHVTDDDRAFVDLTVDTADGPQTITTTAHHSFYDVTNHSWTDAENLRVGDELQAPGGGRVKVMASRHYTAKIRTYNLTIDHVHTYYVEAGRQAVLVHNTACANPTIEDRALNHIIDDHGPGASQTRRDESFVGEFDEAFVYDRNWLRDFLLKIVRETPDSVNPSNASDRHVHFYDNMSSSGKPLEVGEAGIQGGHGKIRTNRIMVVVDERQRIITAMPYDPHYHPVAVTHAPMPAGKDHFRPPGTNLNMS
jgi:RHS repeat-associated protein